MNSRWVVGLFSLLAVTYIVLSQHGEFVGSAVVKILPLLLLAVTVGRNWFALNSSNRSRGWWLCGLGFGMVGDVLLAIDGKNLFVFGLGAFLVGHLGYLLALRPVTSLDKRLLLPYALYAFGVIQLMWPQLGAMALPVMIYISVILLMSLATWATEHSNRSLQLGGLLFIVSDSLIGLNKFWQPIPFAGELIMLTYYAAQWLLAHGMLKRAQTNSLIFSTSDRQVSCN